MEKKRKGGILLHLRIYFAYGWISRALNLNDPGTRFARIVI